MTVGVIAVTITSQIQATSAHLTDERLETLRRQAGTAPAIDSLRNNADEGH